MTTPADEPPQRDVVSSIPHERWRAAIDERISRRKYEDDPVGESEGLRLARTCAEFLPYEGARVEFVQDAPPRMFTGWLLGMYGKVSSPSALVFVGDTRESTMPERVGYTAEGLVLEATSLGLGTCWIGGGVRREFVSDLLDLAPHERVYSISALGYAPPGQSTGERITRGATHRARPRKTPDEVAGGSETWPAWARAGLESALIAPSASNRQPWRFSLQEDVLEVSYAGSDTPMLSKRMDCGIAMLHFEIGARAQGADGTWELPGAGRVVGRWRTA